MDVLHAVALAGVREAATAVTAAKRYRKLWFPRQLWLKLFQPVLPMVLDWGDREIQPGTHVKDQAGIVYRVVPSPYTVEEDVIAAREGSDGAR